MRIVGSRGISPWLRKSALASGAAIVALGTTAPSAYAAAAQYAQWNIPAGLVTVPAKGFPAGHISTDSTAPGSPSGQSAFLNASTPFGQAFGSSQGQPYALLHLASGRKPSTTVISFDSPPAAGTWGFALGDVDAEDIHIDAYDAAGTLLPVSALGFQSVFNFCNGSPLPSTCKGTTGTDVPTWSTDHQGHLAGNVTDTDGASGWFRPTAAISTLVLTSTLNTGIPAYQVWIAGEDQPAPVERERPTVPPVTPPGEPLEVKVCDGKASDIDLVGAPAGGTIDAHPERCAVTYQPNKGFVGEDSFTLKIVTPDGKVLIKSFDVKVARILPDTGAGDLVALGVLAGGLLAAGFVLTIGVQRAERRDEA
jgi:hypothetical protein